MNETPPSIKWQPAEERHEAFYQAIVKAALDLKLRDEEVAALTGRMLGYQRAYAPDASSVPHLVNVFRQNMREGFIAIKHGDIEERSRQRREQDGK